MVPNLGVCFHTLAGELDEGDNGEMRFWRRYSPEITVLEFLVTVITLILALNLRSGDWPLVVLVLVLVFSLSVWLSPGACA